MNFLSLVEVGDRSGPVKVLTQEVNGASVGVVSVAARNLEAMKDQILDLKVTNLSLRDQYKTLSLSHSFLLGNQALLKLKLGIDCQAISYLDEEIARKVQNENPRLENKWVDSQDEDFIKNQKDSLDRENEKISSEIKILKLESRVFFYENQLYEKSFEKTKSVFSRSLPVLVKKDVPDSDSSSESESLDKDFIPEDIEMTEEFSVQKKKKLSKFIKHYRVALEKPSIAQALDNFSDDVIEEKKTCLSEGIVCKGLRQRVDFRSIIAIKQYEKMKGVLGEIIKLGEGGVRGFRSSSLALTSKDVDPVRLGLAREFYHQQLRKEEISKEIFSLLVNPLRGWSTKRCDLKKFIFDHSANKARCKNDGILQEVVLVEQKQQTLKSKLLGNVDFILNFLIK